LAKLSSIDAGERFDDLAALLLDQAMLAEGQLPKDPAATARRMHEMLVNAV